MLTSNVAPLEKRETVGEPMTAEEDRAEQDAGCLLNNPRNNTAHSLCVWKQKQPNEDAFTTTVPWQQPHYYISLLGVQLSDSTTAAI